MVIYLSFQEIFSCLYTDCSFHFSCIKINIIPYELLIYCDTLLYGIEILTIYVDILTTPP